MYGEKWLVCDVALVLTGVIVCLYIAFRFVTRNNDYFAKRNVPYIKPTVVFGNTLRVFMRKVSMHDSVIELYSQLDGHKIGGTYQLMQPVYLVRDPELIKHVTVKDFEHFVDLPAFIREEHEPILTKGLPALKGQKWKDMRSTLSPAFTSNKMKILFTLISETSKQLTLHLENCLREQETAAEHRRMDDSSDILSLELKDLFTKFTNDVIATTAFGVQCNTLQNPDNEFYKMGKEFTRFSLLRFIILIGYVLIPNFMKMLGVRIIPKKISDFFRTLVTDSIKFREREGIIRPDMIHLLMQVRDDDLREDGNSSGVNPESEISSIPDDTRNTKISLSIDDIAAQALVFFSAGFEFVAVLLSFSTLLLAVHQDIQQQVKDEIDEVLAEHGGQVTYEAVQRIRRLDNVLSETLRMYPPAAAVSRRCVKEYHVPGTGIKLEQNCIINVPINGLHHDPQFFPDPETFNPDRFSENNKHNIQPFTYMPFGSGPRHCIANRFVLLETKVTLVHLLSHFDLHTTSKTQLPLRFSKKLEMTVEGGFWCGFKLRRQVSNASVGGHD